MGKISEALENRFRANNNGTREHDEEQQKLATAIESLNHGISKISDLLGEHLRANSERNVESAEEKNRLRQRQFEVMASDASLGSFCYSSHVSNIANSSKLVERVIKRFSVGLGFTIPNEYMDTDHSPSAAGFRRLLLEQLHLIIGHKPRVTFDNEYYTIFYS